MLPRIQTHFGGCFFSFYSQLFVISRKRINGSCGFGYCGRILRSELRHLSVLNNFESACHTIMKEHLPLTGNKTHYTVAVEGNIGSGKSTLLQHFGNLPHCEVFEEPIDKWTNVKGHNALGLLYENPQRWSFSFNMFAQLTRVQIHTKPHTRPVKIMERSLYSTRYCFVQNDYINNTINGLEFGVLDQWFQYLVNTKKLDLDLIVYLRADPEVCLDRMRKRSRTEELSVSLDFLQALHSLHDDWLLHKKFHLPAPVIVLDANYELEKMKETYDSRRPEILFEWR